MFPDMRVLGIRNIKMDLLYLLGSYIWYSKLGVAWCFTKPVTIPNGPHVIWPFTKRTSRHLAFYI